MLRKPLIVIAAVVALVVAGVSVYAVSNNSSQPEAVQQPVVQVQEEVQSPAPEPSSVPVEESVVQENQSIGLEQAKEIALGQVPGASESDIVKAHEDYDDGSLEYEVEIHHDGYEYEYEILGSSGSIISKDVDRIEWDDRYDD